MKKPLILLFSSALLLSSCGTYTGSGAYVGGSFGSILGSAIGGIAGGPRGSDIGTIIGMAGGAAVGAAIGSAVGAGTGAIIGRHMDKVAEEAAKVENAKVDKVTDTNGFEAVRVTFDSGILFATSSSKLNETSINSLAKLYNILKNNQDCHVDIYGHTDNQGWKNSTAEQSIAKNQTLSEQRAQSVANYLRNLGITNAQLQKVAGQGQLNPVADNSTAQGRQMNRRVEIYLYASKAMVDAANAGTLN